jgi:N-acetyl-gamma-glutamyl-phosphate reductase
MVAINDADFSEIDAVFCCLPHGTTQVTSSRRAGPTLVNVM